MAIEIANRLREYKCHKTVRAAEIVKVEKHDTGTGTLTLLVGRQGDGEITVEIQVTSAYMQKHQPQEGGVYVLYKDGYESFSPAEAFEEGYSAIVDRNEIPAELHTFGWALKQLNNGALVRRAGWNGKGMFIFLVPGSRFQVNRYPLLGIFPEGTEISYRPHIDMKTVDGEIVPWLASQSDVLAVDWELAD